MGLLRSQEYRRLQSVENTDDEVDSSAPRSSWIHFGLEKTLINIIVALSAMTNVLLGLLLMSARQRHGLDSCKVNAEHFDISPYGKRTGMGHWWARGPNDFKYAKIMIAGLDRHPSYKFPYSTGYGPLEATNHTLADEIWEAIDIDPGIVAVPLEWAKENNLAETQVFPWDTSKGLYVVNAFHNIHCLKILHRVVYDAHHGRPLSREVDHVLHCIDHMRKDAMCNADDFLLPTPPHRQGNPGPRGQSRVCRNWDALVGWAKERDACYKHITDDEVGFAQEHREIERYLYCKPDSPYAPKMREYVESSRGALQLPTEDDK